MKGQRVGERAVRNSRRRMNDHSGWFVNHDQVFVFVDDRYGNVFRREYFRWTNCQLNFDFIVSPNFVRRLRQLASDENLSVINQPL